MKTGRFALHAESSTPQNPPGALKTRLGPPKKRPQNPPTPQKNFWIFLPRRLAWHAEASGEGGSRRSHRRSRKPRRAGTKTGPRCACPAAAGKGGLAPLARQACRGLTAFPAVGKRCLSPFSDAVSAPVPTPENSGAGSAPRRSGSLPDCQRPAIRTSSMTPAPVAGARVPPADATRSRQSAPASRADPLLSVPASAAPSRSGCRACG